MLMQFRSMHGRRVGTHALHDSKFFSDSAAVSTGGVDGALVDWSVLDAHQ